MQHTSIVRHISYAMQAPGTWAGGTTRAIYAYPPDATHSPAEALLWVATAAIQRAASYSYFPGRTRLHIPISSGGIRLRFEEPSELVELHTWEQLRFDGARPVRAELIDGPVEAFNIIAHPSVAAEAHILHGAAHSQLALPPCARAEVGSVARVVYLVAGEVELTLPGRAPLRLAAADSLVFDPRPAHDADCTLQLDCLAEGASIVVATLTFQ
jgi:environmental stress-induced protein Ves